MAEKRKTYRGRIELKVDGEAGEFRSVFATFNVVDHDGDVTVPGAFEDGQRVLVEGWNHDYGLPPGKGVIQSDENEAWVDGQFFLDTAAGKDTYQTLKNLDGLEEWSYTFMIENADWGEMDGQEVHYLRRLDVWGVAPVTRGAGIGTRTVALKSALGLTDDEVDCLKTLLKEQKGAGGEPDGDDSEPGDGDEGQVGDGDVSGEPSGPAPGVVAMQVEIELLES